MKSRFILALLLPLCVVNLTLTKAHAQSETHDFITYDTLFNVGYANLQFRFRISRPVNMFTTNHPDTASRPALISMPGLGEVGTNYANLQKYGPHYWLNNGWDGGIQLGNGRHYPILITVLPSYQYPRGPELNLVLDHLLNTYRIKRNSVHLAGLSMGGFSWGILISHQASAGDETGMKKVKSYVALQGVSCEAFPPYLAYNIGWKSFGRWASKYGGKFFGLEGTNDGRDVWRVSENMNDSVPGSAYFAFENIGGGAHCCWNQMYDPSRTNWRCIAPLAPNIVNNTFHPNTMGTYTGGSIFQWMLRQGDTTLVGQDGTPAADAPVVNAGSDQSLVLPLSSVSLTGTATPAGGTTISSYAWTKLTSGAATIVSPNTAATTVTGLSAGIHTFRFTATSNTGASASDDVQLIITAAAPPPNQAPTADAGSDQSITLPTSSVTLSGSGADSDGSIASYQWTRISGPTSFNFSNANAAQTQVNSLTQGTYQFQLRVTDNQGATATDAVTIVVNAAPAPQPPPPPPNQAPVANAGAGQTITLPMSSVTLNGSGTDADGSIASYAWAKVSGGAAFIVSPSSATTDVTGLTQGSYVFRLTVTDNQGATGTSNISVTVNGAQASPSNRKIVTKVAITEYKVGYLASDSNFYSFTNQVMQPYNLGGKKVVDVCAGFNVLIMLDNEGYVWRHVQNNTVPVRWNTDTTGAAFNNNIAIYGYYPTYTSIRSDSSLWYWGEDNYNLFPGTAWITKPIKLSPPGMKVKKVVMGGKILVLTTNGQVWEWTKNGSLTPTQINIPRPAIDIFGSHWNYQGCIIPDPAPASQTMGYPYVWGSEFGFWGGTAPYSQPTPIRNLWNLTAPIKEIATSYNTTHYIDSLGRMFGIGDNPNGEVGNGQELVNHSDIYPTPFAWSWNKGEKWVGAPPVEIGVGIRWKKLFSNNTLAFFKYAQDENDSLYSWGRNKALALGNGYLNMQEAQLPNAMDVLVPTMVSPLSAKYQQYNFTKHTINAGPDQTITSSVATLSGSGTPSKLTATGPLNNGRPTITYDFVSYLWTKISGAGGAITSPNSLNTTVTGLTTGTYKFKLLITDNNTGTIADTVTINVSAGGNQPPTANAGQDQSITLPNSTVILTGTGSDPDGSIASYSWTKISGPASFAIGSPASAQTTISGLVQGVYQFELKVTDNQGAMATDVVTVTVNAAPAPPNQAPAANAGSDISITLPVNSVNLSGSGIDPDGTIVGYQWSRISGPVQFAIVNAGSAQTAVNALVEGTYQFQLRVTDNQGATATDVVTVTVNPAPVNQLPAVNAGNDISITLPQNSVSLSGTASDPDGSITSYQWTRISGPAQYNIVSPGTAQTEITGLVQGVYEFQLRVTDNQGATANDIVVVTVNAAPPANQAPIANAGSSQTITLPVNTATLSGSGIDPDGSVVSYQWNKVSGPAQYSITSAAQAQTAIADLVEGVYEFELVIQDNEGAIDKDTVKVTVNAAAAQPPVNTPPTADAGSDINVVLPVSSIILSGNGADIDGSITAYLWEQVSGPAASTLVSPGVQQTFANGLVQGVYQFKLTVTDNQGATGTDFITVTVSAPAPPPNQAPVANAGSDVEITLPVNSVSLNGSGTDNDGSIVAYEWVRVSGPLAHTILTPAQQQTSITDLEEGVYIFRLTVTDNEGASSYDEIQVTVNAALPPPNQAPVANAGADKDITLPVNTETLNGAATDADGTVITYQWTKLSGPAQYAIASPAQPVTVISNLVEGVYVFRLTVTDNDGAVSEDDVQVTVHAAPPPPNQPPVANAGANRTIVLPNNTVNLLGSGTDSDGTIQSYLWEKLTGPASYVIVSPNQPQTIITGLTEGSYTFRLTVTDDDGASASDLVQVRVEPAPNVPPVAFAGENDTITLPLDSLTVIGQGTDADGVIVDYQWRKISGPDTYQIVSPTAPATEFKGLIEGIYRFELSVRDNAGAIARDTVTITVKPDPRVSSTASIYPNPTSGRFNLKIDAITNKNRTVIKVYDERGALVHQEEFLRSQQVVVRELDLTYLNSGVYLLVVNTDINTVKTLKFVKQ
ncbi:MAG TPA: T9SS type A sorting domain-containing protein [Flavisolibacter sp.]|nr:T9SS type A sorting domain-containing protein [Flavisolibacter sp.]